MIIQNQSKKIVTVHDLSCIGRVSMMSAVPILTNMGLQVCPLPTALLSCHTQFPEYTFLDLTEEMKRIIDSWKRLDIRFNAFYTGYLGSPRQVQVVKDLLRDFRRKDDLVVVDPVLGDNGSLYKGMSLQMVEEMRSLVQLGNVISPNVTEMFLLLNRQYQEGAIADCDLKEYLTELSEKGPEIVIVTNVPVANSPHLTSVYAYNRMDRRFWKVTCPFLPAHYPGTGDSFTSVITGSLLQGDSLPVAIDRATQFILQGIRATFGYEYNNMEGIMLEKVVHTLDTPIQMCTYELI